MEAHGVGFARGVRDQGREVIGDVRDRARGGWADQLYLGIYRQHRRDGRIPHRHVFVRGDVRVPIRWAAERSLIGFVPELPVADAIPGPRGIRDRAAVLRDERALVVVRDDPPHVRGELAEAHVADRARRAIPHPLRRVRDVENHLRAGAASVVHDRVQIREAPVALSHTGRHHQGKSGKAIGRRVYPNERQREVIEASSRSGNTVERSGPRELRPESSRDLAFRRARAHGHDHVCRRAPGPGDGQTGQDQARDGQQHQQSLHLGSSPIYPSAH